MSNKLSLNNITLMMCVVVVTSISFSACAGMRKDQLSSASEKEMINKWGVKVIGIRRTAADYMLDFRFRIIDKDKVATIMDRKIKPELIVEKNGAKLRVPNTAKIGPLRQSAKYAKNNKNYFMFFANPGRQVKSGDKVTVVIGDFKAEHIVVQ
jgi:hypothetical protein